MRPQIVLELSGNAAGSLNNCVDLIDAGKTLNCPLKFQRFNPERLAKRRAGILWHGKPQNENDLLALYRKTETPIAWWPEIIETLGTWPWSCSVFDQKDLDFMENLDCPAYKIASYELHDTQLIAAVAETGKPLTISIPRRATPDEVLMATNASFNAGLVTFLYATRYFENHADYQQHFADEIARFRWTRALVAQPLGLSDHSPAGCSLLAHYAVQSNAPMIERHLKLAGVASEDDAFSLTPPQMDDYINCVLIYAAETSEVPHAAEAVSS